MTPLAPSSSFRADPFKAVTLGVDFSDFFLLHAFSALAPTACLQGIKSSVVAHACNPSSAEVEARTEGSLFEASLGYTSSVFGQFYKTPTGKTHSENV